VGLDPSVYRRPFVERNANWIEKGDLWPLYNRDPEVIYDGKCNRLQQKEKEEYVCELVHILRFCLSGKLGSIRYDRRVNVDSKAQCDQLKSSTRSQKNIKRRNWNKQTLFTCRLSSVAYRFKIREGSPAQQHVHLQAVTDLFNGTCFNTLLYCQHSQKLQSNMDRTSLINYKLES